MKHFEKERERGIKGRSSIFFSISQCAHKNTMLDVVLITILYFYILKRNNKDYEVSMLGYNSPLGQVRSVLY